MPDAKIPEKRHRPEATGGGSTGLSALIAVLTFATIYTVASRWFGVSTSAMAAVLAAIPGILLAARGRRR
jgi:uncharacterized membrane protein